MSFSEYSDALVKEDPPDSPEVFQIEDVSKTLPPIPVSDKTTSWTKTTHITLISIGLAVHAYDLISDILYIVKTDFYNGHLYRSAIAFVILSPLLQCLLTVSGLWSIYHISKRSPNFDIKSDRFILKGVVALLLSMLGLFDVIFLIAVIHSKSKDMLGVFHSLSKAFAFISAVFEAIPQIIVTMLNNYYTNTWTSIGIASIIGSSFAALYDSLSCVRSFDNLSKVVTETEPVTPVSTLTRAGTRRPEGTNIEE